jgi:hypothetical protein
VNQEPKVVGGLVSESLRGLITRQVEDHALVIWYDPEKNYGNVAETLTLPKTSIAQYNGSFFQLRREIDPLLNDMRPPRLLVYVPMDQGETDHALAELEAAGVVVQPGQQPPSRNTRLSLVARNALRPLRGDANAAEIEKQVEEGKLTLADLDVIGEKKDSGVLSLIFGTATPRKSPSVSLPVVVSTARSKRSRPPANLLTCSVQPLRSISPASHSQRCVNDWLATFC